MANEKPGGAKIPKAEANKMRKAYEKNNKGKTQSVLFSADFVRSLINDPSIGTVSIDFAENEKGANTVIIRTIPISGSGVKTLTDEGEDGDRGQLCPPNCQV